MSHYKYHVFFCCNQREAGAACCKNQAGCMDRCNEGPVIAIYPQEIWYTYVDKSDIDEIIDEHLVHGRIVERLRI